MPDSPTRTWRYVRASGENSQYYVSSDGFEIYKVLEDWPTKDFYWQVVRPGETEDTINHNEAYCTAKAAKEAIAKLPVEESDAG